MGLPVPKVFTDLGQAVLTKVADKFVDFIIIKYTGKSIKVFQAEGDIAADKIMTRWEVLEKPFWLQAEAKKMNRQYSNVEKIVLKATPHIIATENKITEDNDIFWGLLEHSKEISNDEMQTLIAKIIAGEYNSPETYSMSTLQVIKMLDKKTLNIFEDICCFLINGDHLPAFLFSSGHSLEKFMKEKNIDFGKLQLLQSLGLFFPNPMTWNAEKQNIEDYALSYFSEKILYSIENERVTTLSLPSFYQLSPVGEQILKHLSPRYIEDYYVWIKNNYKIRGYKLKESNLVGLN